MRHRSRRAGGFIIQNVTLTSPWVIVVSCQFHQGHKALYQLAISKIRSINDVCQYESAEQAMPDYTWNPCRSSPFLGIVEKAKEKQTPTFFEISLSAMTNYSRQAS